eukprot:14772570-Alexandrium_andersonii.AAC.1
MPNGRPCPARRPASTVRFNRQGFAGLACRGSLQWASRLFARTFNTMSPPGASHVGFASPER